MELGPIGLLLTFARRGEEEVIGAAIARLREGGASHIVAVGTEISAPVLQGFAVDEIIPYGEGQGVRAVIRELRRRHSVSVAIVYLDAGWGGHLKLELLALVGGARSVLCLAPGRVKAIPRWRLLGRTCRKTLGAVAILSLATALCGLACCWLWLRQVFAGGTNARRD